MIATLRLRDLEMAGYLLLFRALSIGANARILLDVAEQLADWLATPDRDSDDATPPEWGGARRSAQSLSQWIPGARCLHRALASRIWLARRGIEAEVVVGFQRREQLQGHAWLERQGKLGAPARLFLDDPDDYREVFRG